MRRMVRTAAMMAVVAAAACGGGGMTAPGTGGGTGGGGNTGGSTSSSIAIGDNFFSPNSTTVPVGTTVTWTWGTGTTHNVTFADGLSSGDQNRGSYTRTFHTAGTFAYQCTIHAGMNGEIVVQ